MGSSGRGEQQLGRGGGDLTFLRHWRGHLALRADKLDRLSPLPSLPTLSHGPRQGRALPLPSLLLTLLQKAAATRQRRDDALKRADAADARNKEYGASLQAKTDELASLQDQLGFMRELVRMTQRLSSTLDKTRLQEEKHVSQTLPWACTELAIA